MSTTLQIATADSTTITCDSTNFTADGANLVNGGGTLIPQIEKAQPNAPAYTSSNNTVPY